MNPSRTHSREARSKNCKKAYQENQFCHHIPDNIKLRLYTMEKFTKYDTGKVKHSLLPSGIMDGVLDVMAFGAEKYEKDNWKKCESMSSYYDACHRHLEQFWGGVDIDEESTLHHLDHALCNLVFLRWLTLNKEEADDRTPRVQQVEQDPKREKRFSIPQGWTALFRDSYN